jgi:tripartite-type tricarboxylate transporter receptor subunit TctC
MSNFLLPTDSRPGRRRAIQHAAVAAVSVGLALPHRVFAQNLPIRIVVGYAPGGAADRAARIVGERMQKILSRPVIVDNRPGAGGRLAAQQLVNAPSDQTTLMLGNPTVMSVAPLIYKDLKYDPAKDFVPVAAVNDYEFGVGVGASVPVKEINHLLAWIRANPEKSNAGVPATGSLPHFFTLMLSYMAQVKIEVIGYRGAAPLLTDLIGGQIPMAFATIDALLPLHEQGKLRLLATSGAKRSAYSPTIPTFRDQGLPIVAAGWNVMFAPASTPVKVTELLSKTIFQIMSENETRAKFTNATMTPVAMTQTQTMAMLKAFHAQWAPVIKRSAFKPES